MEIIDFKKDKMKLLIKEQQKSYGNAKICYICKGTIEDKYVKYKIYCKVRDRCHYTGEHRGDANSICNLKFSVTREILIVFHNGCNYDYHVIVKVI